jgi:O-antigen ligase
MMQPARWIDENKLTGVRPGKRLSFVNFLKRYPIFLLAFGPPIFRPHGGIDATKGVIDFWAFFQVVFLAAISSRAIFRLMAVESILIPKQIRSILKYAFFLGLLYLASATYSPSRPVSAAYSILYILAWICVAEFLVDAYKNPPDWMQCLFSLRLISLLLLALAFLTLPFKPDMVMSFEPGIGIRIMGGTIAPVGSAASIIAIISAYTFLHSLESKGRSVVLFLVGLAGTLITQSRGAELALFLCLAILFAGWAKTSKRSAYIFISGFMAFVLFSGVVIGVAGGGRLWNTFNRGQDAAGIASASGRTDIWKFVIQYCIAHPQGMGYEAGFRVLFRDYVSPGILVVVSMIGNAHNTFLQVLADAGWLALAAYLIMMTKTVVLGWRFARKHIAAALAPNRAPLHALRCVLVLLILCFADGMNAADFGLPLRAAFYTQNLIVAIILGISANMIEISRAKKMPAAN